METFGPIVSLVIKLCRLSLLLSFVYGLLCGELVPSSVMIFLSWSQHRAREVGLEKYNIFFPITMSLSMAICDLIYLSFSIVYGTYYYDEQAFFFLLSVFCYKETL